MSPIFFQRFCSTNLFNILKRLFIISSFIIGAVRKINSKLFEEEEVKISTLFS